MDLSRFRIMVVEDQEFQRRMTLRLLKDLGAGNLLEATNGREALELLADHSGSVDIVISDIAMPEMNGYELCRRIRADENTRDIPVILLTALSDKQDVVEALACGADSFITKPYSPEYLLVNIEQTLAGKPSRPDKREAIEMEIPLPGLNRRITADPKRIVSLLLSTFEAAAYRNIDLAKAQDELSSLNQHLMHLVEERTAALSAEVIVRKRTEAVLQTSETRLRKLLAADVNSVLIVDRDGIIQYANPAAEALFQCPSAELIGQEFGFPITPGESAEQDISAKTGRQTLAEILSVDLEWEGQTAKYVTLYDITARKRVEAALRENEDRYRDLVDNSQEMIATYDLEGNLISVNEMLIRNSGYAREALLQMNMADLLLPKMRHLFPGYLKTVGTDGKAHGIMQVQTASGEARFWEYVGTLRTEGVPKPIVRGMAWDITDRRNAEKALQTKESQLKAILEATDDGILAVDHQGRIIKSNRRFADLWGIPESLLSDGDDQAVLDHVLAQVSDSVTFLENVRSPNTPDATELDLIHFKDGRCFERFSSPMLEGEAITGRVWSFRDITERKRAEAALLENEDRYRDLVDNSREVIATHDLEGNFISVNDTTIRITGYPREALLKMNLVDLISPERRHLLPGYLATLRAVGKAHGTMQIQTASGETRILEHDCTLRTEGVTLPTVRAMALDISEQKQAEMAFGESEEKLRMIIEHSTQLFFSHTPGNVMTYVSPQVREFLDARAEDAYRPWTDLLTDNPVNAIGVDLTRRAIETGERQRPFELELQTPRGRKLWVEVHESPVVEQGKTIALVGALTDITESKQVHDRLRLQSSALEAAANAILITDRQGLIEWSNPAFTAMTGYSAAEAIGKRPADLIKSGKHDQAFYKAMWDTLLTGEVWQDEIINRRKDGGLYTEEMTITPLRDERGEITHFIAVKLDISQRKQAEQERQDADARIREQASLLNKAHDAISVRDMDHRILFWNVGAERLYGWTAEEVIGHSTVDRLYDDPTAFHEATELLLATDEWNGRIQQRRKDGNLLVVESHWTLVRGEQGQPRSVLAINTDITEHVEAEGELQRYTGRLEAMREIDAALLGARSTTELAQGALTRLRQIVPFERASMVLFGKALTEGTILAVDQDQPWLPLAGEIRPIEDFHDLRDLTSAPFLDLADLSDIQGCVLEELLLSQGLRNLVYIPMESEGILLGFVALSAITPGMLSHQHAEIALDITDQLVVAIQHTRMREELELSNQMLESKVEKRTAELRTTVATLQVLEGVLRQRETEALDASEAKSTFLASMSHELRTPLIGVTGMLEILNQSDLTEEQSQVVAIINESSESLLRIIGDILDFSKIEANKLELAPQTFSARRLMESVSQTFGFAVSSKGLNFIVEVDPRIAPAHVGDALRIRQVLNNFLSNAVKFTERGSITLRLLQVESQNAHETLVFEVQDTGIGVSRENLEKLFEPFTQAEASTTRRFGGTGLGLTISRRLAELMGGSLTLQSALGEGTTMALTLDLPVGAERDIADPKAFSESMAVSLRPEPSIDEALQEHSLILMAEDHAINRTVLTQQVNRAGFALEVAVDGQEAFEKWRSGRYALLLTDLHMQRMDGYQLTKAVRDWERTNKAPRKPILALTANAMGGEAERCIKLGMDDYLIKPVTIPLLAFKLHQWMPHLKSGKVPEAAAPPAISSPKIEADKLEPDPMGSRRDASSGPAAGLDFGTPSLPSSPSSLAAGYCPVILLPLQPVMDVPQVLNRLNGKEPLLLSILQGFLGELPRPEDAIAAAVEAGDAETGFRIAHTLKGVAANLALSEVAQAAGELEKLLRAGSCEGCGEPLARLENAMARFRALAAHLLTVKPQPIEHEGAQGDPDPRRTLRLLLELDSLLKRNSFKAKRAFETLAPILAARVAQESLDRIQADMNLMDYSGARTALQPLVGEWQGYAASAGSLAPEVDP